MNDTVFLGGSGPAARRAGSPTWPRAGRNPRPAMHNVTSIAVL